MERKQGRKGKKTLKVQKNTLRSLTTRDLGGAAGGRYTGGSDYTEAQSCKTESYTKTMQHNQALLRSRRRSRGPSR